MKGRYLLLILSVIFVFLETVNAQTSVNEKEGFWENSSTWAGGTMPGSVSSGTIDVFLNPGVTIAGRVKTQNNLSVNTSTLTINSGDTLIVYGNFIATTSTISNSGLLIVLGNFSNSGSNMVIWGTGKMVVTGNYSSVPIISNNTFLGPAYVYGSRPAGAQTEAALATNDAPLHSYVDYILGVLPVELISVDAMSTDEGVVISWQTASETNNSHFLLENSMDGTNFKTVTTIQGAGDSKTLLRYSFTDADAFIGRSYYRLVQVDFSGATTVYEIIKVDHQRNDLVKIFPNPAVDYLHTNVDLASASVIVHNIQGIPQNVSINERRSINVSNLERGVYYLRMINVSGQNSRLFRFIKE